MNPLQAGIDAFNEGRWWHAHEPWEHHWRTLAGPAKLHLQSRIMACGAFFLIGRGRFDAAARLARLGLARLSEAAGEWPGPRVEIPGLEPVLSRVADDPRAPDLLGLAAALRAVLSQGPTWPT